VAALMGEPDVGEHLLARTFERLDRIDRRNVQALAIYGRPVQPAAVDHLLQPYVQGPGSAARLCALHRDQLVRRDLDGHYYVPPTPDRELLLTSIPPASPSDLIGPDAARPGFTRHELRHRAADYFARSHPGPDQITGVDDLRTHFAEIDLRIQAADYDR